MEKGQITPFVFLILLVSCITIGYIFFNTYYGTRYKFEMFQISVIDVVANVIQAVKNYLALALSYSDLQALREHACKGGTIVASPWILNGPNPVTVEQSKACLEKYTLYYFNTYYDLYNTTLPVNITKYPYDSCVYDVDESGVFAKKFDEGYYWVNSSKGAVIVSGLNRNVTMMTALDNADFVTKNRYWYMFRIFYKWAMDDVYSPCICGAIGCGCSSSSGAEACSSCESPTKSCAKGALDYLQSLFDATDDNVKCRMDKLCCQQGIGPPCGTPNACLGWETTGCISTKEHECKDPLPKQKVCEVKSPTLGLQEKSSKTSYASFDSQEKSVSTISFSPDGCWFEGRVSAGYRYTCQDFKYYVPSDKGPVPLTFSVMAFAFFRNPMVCICSGDIC